MIKVSLLILHTDSCWEALNRLVKMSHPVKTDAFVVISKSIVWIYLNRCRIILDGKFKMPQFVKSKAPIEQRFEMDRVNF
jgi:hypothetical protein